MIYVATVNAEAKIGARLQVDNASDAYVAMRLNPLELDSGVLFPVDPEGGVAFVVGMYAIYEAPEAQHYFSVGPRLFAGNAVLYQFDADHQAVDLDEAVADRINPTWYGTADDVEAAIAAGAVLRPTMTGAGDVIIWQWPDPAPPTIAAGMASRSVDNVP